jgi:hypothetical protein
MSKKIVFPISVFLAMVLLALPYACTKESGGDNSNSGTCGPDPVTYTNTMKAIIDKNCISCHKAGGSAATDGIYTSYSGLQSRTAAMFREVVERKTMPTTGPLSQADLDKWKCWKDNGYKE